MSGEERIETIAREIERYLADHPEAADSAEGIARWWLTRQRIHYEVALVEAALAHLRRKGVVVSDTGAGGPLYRLNRVH